MFTFKSLPLLQSKSAHHFNCLTSLTHVWIKHKSTCLAFDNKTKSVYLFEFHYNTLLPFSVPKLSIRSIFYTTSFYFFQYQNYLPFYFRANQDFSTFSTFVKKIVYRFYPCLKESHFYVCDSHANQHYVLLLAFCANQTYISFFSILMQAKTAYILAFRAN